MTSRVARKPVDVPQGVEVTLSGQAVAVKGKHGELKRLLHSDVKVVQESSQLLVEPANDSLNANAQAGTARALLNNMVHGVSQNFECKLILVGVGYRAKVQGKKLNLSVGFSHPVDLEMPEGVTAKTPSATEIILEGADKQQVFQVGANIRAIRPPEPYKGKGIRYADERVVRKETKKK